MSKVLIIEDDLSAMRMIGRILVDAGHQTVEAIDGVDGLRRFRTEAPDLIITDLIMPKQEGIQVITDIRASGDQTPIIAISGGGSGAAGLYLSMAEELGADAILAKPFRPSDLLSLVTELLDPEFKTDPAGERSGAHS
ncbi:MAG TPA: response regulator [Caulobacteraceae bacterium]|jgi:DNA-binding response OmpR family regulator|nr:response regulator [Caulobacteraceae bacterium]